MNMNTMKAKNDTVENLLNDFKDPGVVTFLLLTLVALELDTITP